MSSSYSTVFWFLQYIHWNKLKYKKDLNQFQQLAFTSLHKVDSSTKLFLYKIRLLDYKINQIKFV